MLSWYAPKAASTSTEFFADMVLCPSELVKVKVQTCPVDTFPTAFGTALSKIKAESATPPFPFGSLTFLLSRPSSFVANFYFFEKRHVLRFHENLFLSTCGGIHSVTTFDLTNSFVTLISTSSL
ncbi:Cu/Pi carrier [Rhizophlyctis rosea]|nr:Cu/Pi carrier [Rhizophlyctis rosea]